MHQAVGDAADIHQVGGQEEERHRQQDERVVRLEGLVEEHHRGEPDVVDQQRQAGEPERESNRHPQRDQDEKSAEHDQRGDAGRQRDLGHAASLAARMRRLSTKLSPRNRIQVAPASGQATKMKGIGNSASSDSWYQPNSTNLMPQTRNTSANTSTNRCDTIRSAAFSRRPNSGQISTSKCVPSRMPIIAPSITIQMNRNRDSSSVQM